MAEQGRAALIALGDSNMMLADPAADVRGRKVIDRDGEEIGEVDNLMIDDREGRVRFLRVGTGGVLGLGESHFLIPVEAVTRIDGEHVHVDRTREHVAGAPAYDPETVEADAYYEDLYGYYGYAPYWSPGYVYPGYPYYV